MNADDDQLLVISNNPVSEWLSLVRECWQPFGQTFVLEETAVSTIAASEKVKPQLILIDAATLRIDNGKLVSQLAKVYNDIPIIVATASPNWEQARALFHAGVTDYFKRSVDIDTLSQTLIDAKGRGSLAKMQ